jgi:uncharacterized protein YukE
MAVPDYDTDRRHRTWREVHGWSAKEIEAAEDRRAKKHRNRRPGYFGKINWEAYQHDQLYDMIMKADVGTMSDRAVRWKKLAGKIEATTGDVQLVMERLMGTWRGSASVSSATANSHLMQWAGDASHTAVKIASGMSNYTDAVGEAQTHMPPPAFASAERNFRDGYTVAGTGGPSTAILLKQLLSDGMVSHEEARARKAEAVAVMEAYESQSKDVHDSMPHFSDVKPTTTPPGAMPPPSSSPPPDTPPGSPPSWEGSPPPVSGVVPPVDTSTTAAGFVEAPRGGVSGGLGGLVGGGLGGGGDVARGAPMPGAGGLAGIGGIPARGPGSLGGAPGMRGAGAGAFGGMPLGHGAGGADDKEHKNKYDEGLDLFDDLPPAYPSVFGA